MLLGSTGQETGHYNTDITTTLSTTTISLQPQRQEETIYEGDDGNIEAIEEANEACCLHRGIDIQTACKLLRLHTNNTVTT